MAPWHSERQLRPVADPPYRPAPTPADLRQAAGRFATGVTVVTAQRGQVARGMTANAFTSVSLDPLLVLVSIRSDSEMNAVLAAVGTYAVTVLRADQRDMAWYFADPRRPAGAAQFDPVAWRLGGSTGAPLLEPALAWFECRVVRRIDAGDHTLVLGEVLDVTCGAEADPLVFAGGSFATTAPLAAPAVRAVS